LTVAPATRDHQRMENPAQPLTLPYHDPGMRLITQVAIVCRDIEATSKRWAAVLGVDPPEIRTARPGEEVKMMFRGRPSSGQAKLAFIPLGPQVTLELIQPLGGDTSWQAFLDKNSEGVHHIAFHVADVEKSIAAFAGAGMPVMHQGRFDDDTGSYTYIDSAQALGVTVKLLHNFPKALTSQEPGSRVGGCRRRQN
jgi:catechol 2,3-dioxygenase-like lactoylglutathione lyase family enzyme